MEKETTVDETPWRLGDFCSHPEPACERQIWAYGLAEVELAAAISCRHLTASSGLPQAS